MELFHGPPLSFKDYALQILGRLFDHVLEERGERIIIVGATSGDTGSAAIEACRHCKNIDIFILHPEGRTSEVQRRQMTTIDTRCFLWGIKMYFPQAIWRFKKRQKICLE